MKNRAGPVIGPSEQKADVYAIEVSEEAEGVVLLNGEEVWRSRGCRLTVQARRLAQDWIDAQMGIEDDCSSITLEVQNLVIDPDTLFGRKKGNG
jgi:hypothetical protein